MEVLQDLWASWNWTRLARESYHRGCHEPSSRTRWPNVNVAKAGESISVEVQSQSHIFRYERSRPLRVLATGPDDRFSVREEVIVVAGQLVVVSHNFLSIRQFLVEKNVAVLKQPPYSPYLASCDFFLFPQLKMDPVWRRGRHQKGRNDGAEEDPGRILPGLHANVAKKNGKWIRLQKDDFDSENYYFGF